MTITQLYYVLAVAEHKNFTLAAEKCFVTQPTLSMQIQKIEEELGILIFDRSKKPIQLTEIGQKIVNQSKNIVNEADRIQDIVDQQKGFIGGEFRLGIIPTVMPTLLPMFLNNFIKKYPKVNLIIEELNTTEIIVKLKNGHLDAAIAVTPLEEEKIKEVVLYFEPFVAYIPESHAYFEKKEIEKSGKTDDATKARKSKLLQEKNVQLLKIEQLDKSIIGLQAQEKLTKEKAKIAQQKAQEKLNEEKKNTLEKIEQINKQTQNTLPETKAERKIRLQKEEMERKLTSKNKQKELMQTKQRAIEFQKQLEQEKLLQSKISKAEQKQIREMQKSLAYKTLDMERDSIKKAKFLLRFQADSAYYAEEMLMEKRKQEQLLKDKAKEDEQRKIIAQLDVELAVSNLTEDKRNQLLKLREEAERRLRVLIQTTTKNQEMLDEDFYSFKNKLYILKDSLANAMDELEDKRYQEIIDLQTKEEKDLFGLEDSLIMQKIALREKQKEEALKAKENLRIEELKFRTKEEMEEVRLIEIMPHRSLSEGEGNEG